MKRLVANVALALIPLCGMGCAMCCSPDLYQYPTFGGRVERSDPELGRVGSIFSDPWMDGSTIEVPPNEIFDAPAEAVERSTPQAAVQPAPSQSPPANARRRVGPEGWR